MQLDFYVSAMARPLGVRGYQKRRFTKASFTMGQELHVESQSEGCTLLALDIDPRVSRIKTQPFTLRLDLERLFLTKKSALAAFPSVGAQSAQARERHIERHLSRHVDRQIDRQIDQQVETAGQDQSEMVYTPDFLVELGRETALVVECKPSDQIDKIKTAMDRRKELLNKLGYHFITVSEQDIGFAGLMGNLIRMRDAMNYLRKNDTQSDIAALMQVLGDRSEPFLLGDIRGQVSDLAINLGLASGVLACDLRQGALGTQTVVWPAQGDLSHLQLLNFGV